MIFRQCQSLYGFSIFATVRCPIRLRRKPGYRIWTNDFPASRFLVFGVEPRKCGQSVSSLPTGRAELQRHRLAIAARTFRRQGPTSNPGRAPSKVCAVLQKSRPGECANELADSGYSAVQNKQELLRPKLANDAHWSNEPNGQREEVPLRE